MDQAEFETIKLRAMGQHRHATGLDLKGFMMDLDHYLSELGLFGSVKVRKTGDLGRLVEAVCAPRDPDAEGSELAAAVERLWLEELCYPDFEAHAISTSDEHVILDFVTTSGAGGYYVTGRISISTGGGGSRRGARVERHGDDGRFSIAYYEDLERRLRDALADVAHLLPPEDVKNVAGFIDHNEFGLALETLSDALFLVMPSLRQATIEKIESLVATMGLSRENVEQLRELVVE